MDHEGQEQCTERGPVRIEQKCVLRELFDSRRRIWNQETARCIEQTARGPDTESRDDSP